MGCGLVGTGDLMWFRQGTTAAKHYGATLGLPEGERFFLIPFSGSEKGHKEQKMAKKPPASGRVGRGNRTYELQDCTAGQQQQVTVCSGIDKQMVGECIPTEKQTFGECSCTDKQVVGECTCVISRLFVLTSRWLKTAVVLTSRWLGGAHA
jgi:hypothetical protein